METLREIKTRARADLHGAMQVAALYLVENPAYVTPVVDPLIPRYLETEVSVRVHYDFGALGDMKGTNFHYAEREEIKPQIFFLFAELPNPQRNAIVSVSADEAWRVDHILPRDGITIKVEATRVTPTQMIAGAFPYPGSTP